MGGKAALVLVLGFAFVWGYVSNNLSRVSNKASGNSSLYVSSVESHTLALSGANAGLAKLYQNISWRGSAQQSLKSGTVQYTSTTQPDSGILLRSISSCPGPHGMVHDTVEVYLDPTSYQSFALYAWMTGNENGVYWTTTDTVWGRVHSNSAIWVSGKPVFMGKVTTSKTITKKSSTDAPIFKAGLETGVASVDFPNSTSDLQNAATAGGKLYGNDITVTLNPGTAAANDGYAIIVNGTKKDTIKLSDPAFNGALYSTGRVTVKGVLDGKLTLGSKTDIYVSGSILYENTSLKTTDDVLGLVADNDVVVQKTTENSTGCTIYGSIFARLGSFTAEDYNSGSPRGALRLFGSIVQKTRGPVGTLASGGGVATGYSKRYTYDDRLSDTNFRPPFYPGFYRKTPHVAGWWENVRASDWWD